MKTEKDKAPFKAPEPNGLPDPRTLKVVEAAITKAQTVPNKKGKTYKGAHLVFCNVNSTLKEIGLDPYQEIANCVALGRYVVKSVKGGASIYREGEVDAGSGVSELRELAGV